MPETISNEVLYEVLKSLQAGIKYTLAEHSRLVTIREDIHDLRGDNLRFEQTFAALQVDIDRINKRLGLTDAQH